MRATDWRLSRSWWARPDWPPWRGGPAHGPPSHEGWGRVRVPDAPRVEADPRTLAAATLGVAVVAASALGHATLLESKPKPGQVLERSPRTVLLVFDEGIDPAFVQLEVVDRAGRRVDRGEPYHPGGREERLARRVARARPGGRVRRLSYRVISEDGHPVVKAHGVPRAAANAGARGAGRGEGHVAAGGCRSIRRGDAGRWRRRARGHRNRQRDDNGLRGHARARLPRDGAGRRRPGVPVRRLGASARAGRRGRERMGRRVREVRPAREGGSSWARSSSG